MPNGEHDLPASSANELFLKHVQYFIDAKKIYLEERERTERTFLVTTGALMAFLCTDAVPSVDEMFYPYLWFIPLFVVSMLVCELTQLAKL